MREGQLGAILWLRWRLQRNLWRRGGAVGALGAALQGLVAAWLVVGGLGGGLALGIAALHGARPLFVTLTWAALSLGFLLVWTLGLVMDLQRAEMVDLPRLMHLPITLSRAFVVNYVASLFGFTLAFFLPATLGLAIGLAIDRGPAMLLLVPLSLGLLFMATAWTYLLQGWIALWVRNPRRRRALISGLALSVALVGQVPNLLNASRPARPGHAATPAEKDAYARAEEAHDALFVARYRVAEKIVPPLWVAGGAGNLAEGDPRFALLGTVGFALLGAFALRRSYLSTLRFYSGAAEGVGSARAASAPASVIAPASGSARLVEWRIPGVPDQATAVAAATVRSVLRSPELLLAIGFTFVMTVVGGVIGRGAMVRHGFAIGPHLRPLVLVGTLFVSTLPAATLLNNQFGLDLDGFRALLLAPVPRARLLLGKNLAGVALCGPASLFVLGAGALWLRVPPLAALAAVFQVVTLWSIVATTGNVLSIFFPYRQAAAKRARPPASVLLALVPVQVGFPFLSFPVYAGPGAVVLGHYLQWRHPLVVDLVVSLAMAAIAVAAYSASLAPLGRLLQRRETLILARVSVEQE